MRFLLFDSSKLSDPTFILKVKLERSVESQIQFCHCKIFLFLDLKNASKPPFCFNLPNLENSTTLETQNGLVSVLKDEITQ